MAKLSKVETQKGGGGFGAPDTSDDLKDMTNYESAILKPEIFEMLSELEVRGNDKEEYQYLVLDATDIPDFSARSMGAAGHAINSEFAVLEIPFRAIPYANEDVIKVSKIVKRGKHVGKEKFVKETNSIKIYRTGENFDAGLYATEESGRTNDSGEPLVYENYTVGQKKRADKWLTEVASEELDPEILEKIGIEIE